MKIAVVVITSENDEAEVCTQTEGDPTVRTFGNSQVCRPEDAVWVAYKLVDSVADALAASLGGASNATTDV